MAETSGFTKKIKKDSCNAGFRTCGVPHKRHNTIKKRHLLYLLLLPLLFLLLAFPQTAAAGALQGLLLWSQVLMPVLLPFLILSGLLLKMEMTGPFARLLSPFVTRLLPLRSSACYPLLLGLFCGMPLGAKLTGELYRKNQLSAPEAYFLLGLANQTSLSFLLGYVIHQELAQPEHTFLFLCILYGSSLIVSLCVCKFIPYTLSESATPDAIQHNSPGIPTAKGISRTIPDFFAALDQSILDSFQTIARIGGYLILFTMLSGFFSCLPLPEILQILFSGLSEVTSGVHSICTSSLPDIQKTALVMAVTAFGGCSGLMQTRSVTLNTGLSLKLYLELKLIEGGIVYLLTFLLLHIL